MKKFKFSVLLIPVKLMKVVADRVCKEEIMKACHEGMGSSQEARVLAGHFGRDKIGAMVAVWWYFHYIFK